MTDAACPAPTPDRAATLRGLVPLLAAIAALGQFASNVYIPALPAMSADLPAGTAAVQASLGVFLAVFAAGQLVAGPLGDRWGRRPVLFAGFGVFAIGTLICALAPDIAALLAGRSVQAAGAAATLVMSRAVTRDLFSGAALARTMALIAMIFALVPGLTPLLGGVLQILFGWRACFAATLLFALAVAAFALRLPETNRRSTARLDLSGAVATYAALWRDAAFRRIVLATGCVFAGLASFFAGGPIVFIERLGVSPLEFGFYPPLAVTGFVLAGLAVRRLTPRVSIARFMLAGLGLMAAAALAMTLPAALDITHKHVFNAGMIAFVTGLGLFLPNAMASALTPHGAVAGSASALLGFGQMTGAALGTAATSLALPLLPLSGFAAVMLAGACLALLTLAGPLRRSATAEAAA
jgi:DHA1 family bicyclomycin/chloramphenicol resistance-like MFS transporter